MWQKVSIFTATKHHGIKVEARQNPFCGSPEAVYRKSVLHNHDMQYAMFKHKEKLTVTSE